jgi:hypothetical protein
VLGVVELNFLLCFNGRSIIELLFPFAISIQVVVFCSFEEEQGLDYPLSLFTDIFILNYDSSC